MVTSTSLPIKKQVDRLFRQLRARRNDSCRNPVTGIEFVWGVDSISEQKLEACRALVARDWHAANSPGAPQLPVHVWDIQNAKQGGDLSHLLAYFAQSLAREEWRFSGHPLFETYATGALASPECPWFFTENKGLLARFPPKPIYGLEAGLVYVRPTKSIHL